MKKIEEDNPDPIICFICKEEILETGTAFNARPCHIGCFHRAQKEVSRIIQNHDEKIGLGTAPVANFVAFAKDWNKKLDEQKTENN